MKNDTKSGRIADGMNRRVNENALNNIIKVFNNLYYASTFTNTEFHS
jgi:hypothetical protein